MWDATQAALTGPKADTVKTRRFSRLIAFCLLYRLISSGPNFLFLLRLAFVSLLLTNFSLLMPNRLK